MLIVIPCTIIFCAWLWYEKRKHDKLSETQSKQFWDREEAANHTRNKDISSIQYITLEPQQIPTIENPSEQIEQCILQVQNLLKNKMADLSGYSNTDLKLEYGVGNFTKLAEYDTNYINLSGALSNLAKHYYNEHYLDQAEAVYQLTFWIGSHKVTDYQGLAKIYVAQDKPEKISSLIQSVQELNLPREEAIISALRKTLASYC